MTRIFSLAFFLISFLSAAQTPCDWSPEIKDSLGVYRSTKDYLVYERDFAGNSGLIYFSLAQTDGMPILNLTIINKSDDFIKANCLNKNSRIFFQLDNGKIVTLIHIDDESCGTSVRANDKNNRVMNGYFMFRKDTFEELKKSPVSLMRIKYSTETVDYLMKESLESVSEKKTFYPSKYFMTMLDCLTL